MLPANSGMDAISFAVPPVPSLVEDTLVLIALGLCFVILLHLYWFCMFWILCKWNHTMFILWLAFSLSVSEICLNVRSCRALLLLAVWWPFAYTTIYFSILPLCVWSPMIYSWSSCSHVDFRISLWSSNSKNLFEIVNGTHGIYRSVLGKSTSTWNWIFQLIPFGLIADIVWFLFF